MLLPVHAALGVGAQQAAGGARQVGLVEPGVARHAGHEQNQVGRKLAALGDHLVRLKALHLVAQVGANATPRHLAQQVLHRLGAQAVARLRGGVEEHQLEAFASALAAQLRVDAEQELEHRPAAHRHGFIRITGKAHGNGAALQGAQPVANLLSGGDAFAGRDGMLDARQLFNEAPAGGDDERVVAHLARAGEHRAPAALQAVDLGRHVAHAHALKKRRQRHDELLARAQAARDPDDAGQVMQLGTRRNQRDLGTRIALAQFAHAGQRAKTGAQDGDAVGHGWCSPECE